MVFGVAYDADIDKVKKVILGVLEKNDLVLKEPQPVVAVDSLGDNAVNFVVRPHCLSADYWNVRWQVTEAIKKEFDAKKISIPFPQREVYIHNKS